MKKENGITLIALVVTIIVILLLAGISIIMLTGDSGILNNATSAKKKTEIAEIEERAQLALTGRLTDKNVNGTARILKDALEEAFPDAIVENVNGADDICYVTKDNTVITVYDNGEIVEGKVSVWKGTENNVTDIESPKFEMGPKNVFDWYISTAGQLKFLADFVNNDNKFTGRDDLKNLVESEGYNSAQITMTSDTMIYLMSDLDLGAKQTGGTLTSGTAWTPIGIDENYIIRKIRNI